MTKLESGVSRMRMTYSLNKSRLNNSGGDLFGNFMDQVKP